MKPNGETHPELAEDDQRILDLLAESGFEPEAIKDCSPQDRQRAENLLQVLGLLNDYPVEDGDDTLVHATLATIDRHEDEKAARLSFDAAHDGMAEVQASGRRFRLPDFISVAAVILIALGVLWPMMNQMRHRSIDANCENNLRQMAHAFSNYAADFDGAMPMAMAGPSLGWDDVKNVINLGPLVEGGYCDRGHLNCPGVQEHEHADASYSYQVQIPGRRVVWGGGPMSLVLSDRNPLVDAYHSGRVVPAMTISLNHDGRGQNVLASDGATLWLKQPVIGSKDNIWLPHGVSTLRRGAAPADPTDTFLTH